MTAKLSTEADDSTLARLIDLQKRAAHLMAEFHAYSDFLRDNAKSDEVEMRMFRRGLESEVDGLDLAISGEQRTRHGRDLLPEEESALKRERLLQTSNVPHYEVWWSVAKQCKGVRGLGRRVVLDGPIGKRKGTSKRSNPNQGQEVQVDIIADDGQEWIKISTMSEKRLVFEMAKEGWERYGDFSDSDTDAASLNNTSLRKPTNKPKLELLRLADSLRVASQTVRSRYRHPRVRFILPRIAEGQSPSIDALLSDIRATRAIVECGLLIPATATSSACLNEDRSAPSLHTTFNSMLPTNPSPPLTPVLNIDCSILIALISDQCHTPPSQLPARPLTLSTPNRTYHAAILAQMADEEALPLLPYTLYPLLQGRHLTCTAEAADRMVNIVRMMGTEEERKRAEIVLGRAECEMMEKGDLVEMLRKYTQHEVPSDLRLPIRVVDVPVPQPGELQALYPHWRNGEVYAMLLRTTKLSTLNAAVLLYGWEKGLVTVTSNQTAVSQVERGLGAVLDELNRENARHGGGVGVGEERDGEEFEPPMFWVVQGCRSLVGKEKRPKEDQEKSGEEHIDAEHS